MSPPGDFADRFTDKIRGAGTPLCCGIDPHAALIPPRFHHGGRVTGETIRDFCFAILPRLEGRIGVIKPQSAFFERFGAEGMATLASLCHEAGAMGLAVIMDAKRGDIGSTSAGYAAAYFGSSDGDGTAPFPCDALTVNPYLGMEALSPFMEAADGCGGGLFALLRTSNPGAEEIQLLEMADGRPLYEKIAGLIHPHMEARLGKSGFSSLGIVAGATTPDEARRLRALLPGALFLVPGYGAQGGSAADALAGLVPGPECFEGGVVNASRGILFPADAHDAKTAADWGKAIDDALAAAITGLRQ